jgi:anti-sigma-K factor RskA
MTDEPLHDLAGAHVLGALDPAERSAFERHLAECAACAAEVRALHPAADGLARVVPLYDPPPGLRERVLRAATGRAPKPMFRAIAANWLVAAASVIVALGLGLYVLQLRDRLADVERRLDEATARAAAAGRQMADLQRASVAVRTAALVLGAPDLLRVDLGSPAGTPAKGRAFWSRSRGLVFTAVDLPPLVPGKVYQLWIVGRAAPVSAAIFEPDVAGRATAVVEPSASLPDPAAFAVTLEPAGGVPQPTGDRVLIGAPVG